MDKFVQKRPRERSEDSTQDNTVDLTDEETRVDPSLDPPSKKVPKPGSAHYEEEKKRLDQIFSSEPSRIDFKAASFSPSDKISTSAKFEQVILDGKPQEYFVCRHPSCAKSGRLWKQVPII